MAVTQMIIVMFAATAFLIGAILGLRFRIFVLIAPVTIGFAVIVAIGIVSGSSVGLIFFMVFIGLTMLQLGYVVGAVIDCFATRPYGRKDSAEIIAIEPRLYRRSQS
jgi:hypothetical protein